MTPAILKVGGAHLADPAYLDRLLGRLRKLTRERSAILVHGGGCEIARAQEQLGMTPQTRNGLRVTSREAMGVVAQVLCGIVNKRIVGHFEHHGLPALGVCGADRGLLRAPFYGRGELGRVGGAPAVDVHQLRSLVPDAGVLVLAPVCLGPDGGLLNVNADTVAQSVAVALHADVLELVTDVDAVHDHTGPIRQLTPDRVASLIADEVVRGGMRPKMQAAVAAVESGVPLVRVGSLSSLTRGDATEVLA